MNGLKRQAGFTLLEMIVALALTATISVVALQLFQGVLHSSELLREKSTRLMQQQFAFSVMENDFSHALLSVAGSEDKGFTPNNDLPTPASGSAVQFLRGNWLNPGGMLQRTQIEVVSYRLRQGELQKVSAVWPADISGRKPKVTSLLTGVEAFTLRYYSGNQWVEDLNMLSMLPKAVEITLVLTESGKFSRVFLLAEE
ncbi:type II secretion system minor pseudopilin GspJ [Erwinia sp. ErVv1]|uniref:type II secretion system minor pseudopilin GspJ n=1 Tax=Erwinia sp. ErVv1 TaxID=1603299 RepID=UPI000834DE2A|nr:type II secretion system minor pseudopilin GspJ [Erwinia sp. ErVv1]